MKPEEVEAKLKEFSGQIDTIKKDYDLKLDAAKKDADQWKEIAQKKEVEAKEFQEKAKKADEDRKKSETEARKAENKAFIEARISDGKMIPAQKDAAISLMDSLSSDGKVAEFKQADGSSKSHSQLSLFKEMIESWPKRVDFGPATRVRGGYKPESPSDSSAEQMEVLHQGARVMMPVADADFAAKAFEYQAEHLKTKGRAIDYGEALVAVQKQQMAGR